MIINPSDTMLDTQEITKMEVCEDEGKYSD